MASAPEPGTTVARDISAPVSPKISSLMWGLWARKSEDTQRSQTTVTEREGLQIFDLAYERVSETIVYEPRFVDGVGLERDLAAVADQGLSSNR